MKGPGEITGEVPQLQRITVETELGYTAKLIWFSFSNVVYGFTVLLQVVRIVNVSEQLWK